MGRSVESIRQGVNDVSARWLKASRALKKRDQVHGQKLAELARKQSGEAFYALDDPLEAAAFSVLVELVKEVEKAHCENETVSPHHNSSSEQSVSSLFGS
jgi:hypothetical protein